MSQASMIATTHNIHLSTQDEPASQPATGQDYYYYWDDDVIAKADKMFSLASNIDLYFKPFLFVTSIVGNALCVVVLASKHYKKVALRYLLMIIACLDIFIILWNMRFFLSIHILDNTSPFMVLMKPQSRLYCGFEFFLFYFSTQLSAWSIVLLTIERFLVTWFPLRAPLWCTGQRMMLAWALVASLLLLINCPIFFIVKYEPGSPVQPCHLKDAEAAWGWVDMTIMCVVPFTFISVFNVLIVYKVYKQVKASKSLTGSSGISEDKVRSLTIMLVTLSLAYLLTTTPAAIYNSSNMYFFPDPDTNLLSAAKSFLILTLLDNIYLLNHVSNFVFYFAFGAKFREATRDVLCARMPCGNRQNKTRSSKQHNTGQKNTSGVATVSSRCDSQQKNTQA